MRFGVGNLDSRSGRRWCICLFDVCFGELINDTVSESAFLRNLLGDGPRFFCTSLVVAGPSELSWRGGVRVHNYAPMNLNFLLTLGM